MTPDTKKGANSYRVLCLFLFFLQDLAVGLTGMYRDRASEYSKNLLVIY